MYWLRWHYHVRDIAGALYKIKKKERKEKQNNRIADMNQEHEMFNLGVMRSKVTHQSG